MFGFGYALVPIYEALCEVTGFNGSSDNMTEAQEIVEYVPDESRSVTIEFVTNMNQNMPWDFKPEKAKMKVHPGKAYQISFFANNKTDRSIVGQAVPKVAPNTAANHLIKTECFCFTNQLLEAGESMEMPVVFVINPALPDHIKTVTLSYTYFDVSNTASIELNSTNKI